MTTGSIFKLSALIICPAHYGYPCFGDDGDGGDDNDDDNDKDDNDDYSSVISCFHSISLVLLFWS